MVDLICTVCVTEYRRRPSGAGPYCSAKCRAIGVGRAKTRSLQERYWAKVDKRGPDECWPWTGATINGGYGAIGAGGHDGKILRANRLAIIFDGRALPDDLDSLHTCDNPPCCNPKHLIVGTHKDNMQDAAKKGRMGAPAKLTDEDVAAIRARVSVGEKKIRLAEEFGVSRGYITILCNGQRRPLLMR